MFRDMFDFDDDSFFNFPADTDSSFRNLENMMQPRHHSIEGSFNDSNRSRGRRNDPFSSVFGDIDSHIRSMQKSLTNFDRDTNFESRDPNAFSHSSSTVYMYNNDGKSEPQVYHAHKSTKKAPGGVREEQKAVRDSRKKEEKMAVGRYIGDRGRQTEKRRNLANGHHEEHNNLFGLDESEADRFNEEWSQAAGHAFPAMTGHRRSSPARQLQNDDFSRKPRHSHKSGGDKPLAIMQGAKSSRRR